ncbi:MAG: PAS domain S-box protein [Nitrospinae bacterium]|nr:PAS domain S-box protein [Nitrospinota bacterium]
MRRLSFPLRFVIPCALFLAATVISTFFLIVSVNESYDRTDSEMASHAGFQGSQMTDILENFLQKDDLEGAKRALSWIGSEKLLRVAFLVDGQDTIILSTSYERVGKKLADTSHAGDSNLFNNTRKTFSRQTSVSSDGYLMKSTFPLVMGSRLSSGAGTKTGVLYIEYDLAGAKRDSLKSALKDFVELTTITALISLITWALFTFTLTRRINRLRETCARLAEGDMDARVNFEGTDELAYVGQSFDNMACRIAEKTQALIESEQRYKNLFENAGDAICVLEIESGKVLELNRRACQISGYSADELAEKSFYDLCAGEGGDLDPRDRLKEFIAQKPGPGTLNIVIRRKDGLHAHLEAGAVITKMGGHELALVVARDVTEKKQAGEERLRLVKAIEQAPVSVMITDTRANIQYVNPAFEALTGYSLGEVRGKNPSILKSGRHDAEFYENIWKNITSGVPWSGRMVNRNKNGDYYHEEATISPVIGPNGDILNYVAIKLDVTQKEYLAKAREYFRSITSHELRTPLTKLGYAMVVLEAKGQDHDSNTGEALEVLHEVFSGLERIVSATTLLNDISVADRKYGFTRLHLLPCLSRCVEKTKLGIAAERRDVYISIETGDTPEDTRVVGNEEMLHRAFDEVMSNAVKYSPEGGWVLVSVANHGDMASIRIADKGIGMPKKLIERMFEPFFSIENPQLHSTGRYKHLGGGIGLGLSITRMIIEYHNGGIHISSEGEGKGSLVTITLPANRQDS